MQNDPLDPAEPLSRALASTRTVLAQVKAGQLDAPTPCASWDVRALTGHFTGTAYWAVATISGIEAPEPEGDPGGDFVAAYQTAGDAALPAFRAEGALERKVTLPLAEFTGTELMWLAVSDQFVHGWDLARAGLDTNLDPELAGQLLAVGQTAIKPGYRGPDGVGLFGPERPAPAGAPPADRLAAFPGRAV
jgi:uncharacterized protein (TIGR03086 family)